MNDSTNLVPEKRLFRPDEVAEILDVSRQTVYNWFDDGTLPFIRVTSRTRRVRRKDLVEIIRVTT